MFDRLTPTRGEDCISDLRFDAWHAHELDARTERRLGEHVAGCARCRAHKRALLGARSEFFARTPFVLAESRRRRAQRALAVVPMLAAAAAVLLFLNVEPNPGELGVRNKGGNEIGFYVKSGERVVRGVSGMTVHPGDALRFVTSVPEPLHLTILSRDGAGNVSVYFPRQGEGRAVPPGLDIPLPSSIELDDVLGRERIYALFCPSPPALERLLRAVQSERIEPPERCILRTLELTKEAVH